MLQLPQPHKQFKRTLFIRTETHNLHIFGVIPCVKLQKEFECIFVAYQRGLTRKGDYPERERERERDRQTDRQETGRQAGRQTDRQTDRDRQRQRDSTPENDVCFCFVFKTTLLAFSLDNITIINTRMSHCIYTHRALLCRSLTCSFLCCVLCSRQS